MSDYESHSGKIRLVQANSDESFEDQCKRLWVENGKSLENYDEGELFDEFYEKYLKINGQIWEVFDHVEKDPYDASCTLNDNGNGTFSFDARFYNGGTCLSEMIRDGLNKLIK